MRSWLKKSRVPKLTDTEAAWLAGFFDGEGSLCKHMGGRNQKYVTWRFSVPNTNLESLEYCSKITHTNSPKLKKKATAVRKTCWQWAICAQREISDVCSQMLPYLIIKKDVVTKFLNTWKDI